MKIKKLRLKNINSFVGGFEIDFSKFSSLFLISGPTGSGKTTIIDAILAALYDETPRLKFSKELLNKDSKEGEIELEFELKDNEYKIKWKAKRNKDIILKRSLYKNGIEIADKKAAIQKEIKDILKLDFKEFTKAIVLAQGEFDAFLSAKSEEKMKLLENILDVSEYEKISIKVFEKFRESESVINEIKSKLQEIDYDKGDLELKEKDFKSLIKKIDEKEKRLNEIEENIKKLEEKNRLINENKELKKEIEEILNKIFSIDIKKIKKNYFELQSDFFEKEKKYAQEIEILEEEIKKEIVLKSLIKNEEKIHKEINNLSLRVKEVSKEIELLKNNINEKEKEKSNIKIEKNKALENFEEINEIVINLKNLREEYKNQLKKIENLKDFDFKRIDKLKELLENNNKKLEYLNAKLIVLKYENERKNLKNGLPCPLCGSLEHPYVLNPPKIEDKIQEEYKKLSEINEKLQKDIAEYEKQAEITKKLLIEAEEYLENIKKKGKNLRDKLQIFGITEDEFEKLKKIKIQNEKNEKKLNEILKEIEIDKNRISEKEKHLDRLKTDIKKMDIELSEIKREKEKIKLKINNPQEKKEEIKSEFLKYKSEFEKKREGFENLIKEFEKLNATKIEKEKRLNLNIEKLKNIQIEDEDFYSKRDELKKEIKTLNINKGELQKELEFIRKEVEKKESFLKKYEAYKKRYSILSKLNKAIGSRDGKKFKQIAINKMIDSLLFSANVHLEILSEGRYVLKKSHDITKIDLEIIDRFYENSIRNVNTLSGGEKFLVSLSFAFGLSDLMREKVKIESMFLDEGFGTLDNYNLSKTLDVLKKASLNKRIGIISHVDMLKEEINQGIKIKKLGGGKSKIEIFY